MKYRNIIVSGDIGSGKSTLARNLAASLGWNFLSMGTFFREWHEEHKIPVINSDEIPENLDLEMDEHYRGLMMNQGNTVFESHLAGFLARDISDIFKVLCVADFEVRAHRVSQRDGVSINEAQKNVQKRSQELAEKFKRLYQVENSFDPMYFDLVENTTYKTSDEVLKDVLEKVEI